MKQLEAEITLETFEYAKHLPKSKRATQFKNLEQH
ncbi:hypothetical protein [Acinetobacter lanii]